MENVLGLVIDFKQYAWDTGNIMFQKQILFNPMLKNNKDFEITSFQNRLRFTLSFSMLVLLPMGLFDVVVTLWRNKYLYCELGDRIGFAGYMMLLYLTVTLVISIAAALFQLIFLRKRYCYPNHCIACNIAILIGLVIFLGTSFITNRLLLEERWTGSKSLILTLVLLILSIVVSVLIFRLVRKKEWTRLIAIAKTRYFIFLTGSMIALMLLGQINFISLLGLQGESEKPNVILISIDTLSAQHMSCYGYNRLTSPNLDQIAAEGILFENCFSQSHWTLPAHMSMLTSLYPSVHGIVNRMSYLDSSFTTIAGALKSAGYCTGAFVDSEKDFYVGAGFGFNQGFDFYDHCPENLSKWERSIIGKLTRAMIRPVSPGIIYKLHSKEKADDIIGLASHWMHRFHRRNPFFLFIHLYDVHSTWKLSTPYLSPEPYQEMHYSNYSGSFTGCDSTMKTCGTMYLQKLNNQMRENNVHPSFLNEDDIAYILATYDGGITYVDSWIGKFFKSIHDMGLDKNTLVIITADHGEEFMEHNQFLHTQYYDKVLHVPLIIWSSSIFSQGKRINDLVMHIDLMPTILDMVDISIESPMQGTSIMPLIESELAQLDRPNMVFAGDDGGECAAVVRTTREKLIHNSDFMASWAFRDSKFEYYELITDLHERDNMNLKAHERQEELKSVIEHWRQECDSLQFLLYQNVIPKKKKLTKNMLQKLRALGYIP